MALEQQDAFYNWLQSVGMSVPGQPPAQPAIAEPAPSAPPELPAVPPPAALAPVPMPADEIEMPPMFVGNEPKLGQPTAVTAPMPADEAAATGAAPAEIEMEPEFVGQGPAPAAIPGAPLQPGIGIPAATLDASYAAGGPAEAPANALMAPDEAQPFGADMSAWAGDAKAIADRAPGAGVQGLQTDEGQPPLTPEEILRLGPLERAEYYAKKDEELAQFVNKGMADIQQTNAARAERAEREFLDSQTRAKEMTEAAIADANALANEKPKKFMDSIGNVIGSVIGIFAGQFATAATGGRNVGLDMVNKRMDDFAQEQINEYNRKAGNVDRKLNIAARLKDAGYNEYQTKTVIRMAGLQRMHDQLTTDAQNFDPQGTAYRRIADRISQTQGEIAKGQRELEKQNLEDDLKRAQLRKAEADAGMAEAKLGKLQGVGGGGAGVGGGGAGAGTVKPGNYTAAQVQKMLPPGADPVPEIPGGYPPAAAKQRVELAAKTAEERRKTNSLYTEGIKTADGRDFEFATPDEAKAFRGKKGALANLDALLGDLQRDIDANGGELSFLKGDASQKYKSRVAQVENGLRKMFDMGTLDDGSQKMMERMRGDVDPASFFADARAGLGTLREDIVRQFNLELSTQPGYDGPGYYPTNSATLPKAKPTAADEALKHVVQSKYRPANELDLAKKSGLPALKDIDAQTSRENVDVTIDKLKEQASGQGAAAALARKSLETIRQTAVAPEVKKRAEEILNSLPKERTDSAR